ncbi:MAG: hypothetical protein HYX55_11290 [Chloroflexi bacterium]|nr:hypothetical protein [Chloroflexota bacterium]
MILPGARRAATTLVFGVLLAIVGAGCGALGSAATPNPSCPAGDVRAPGTLPGLEALLPRVMIQRAPDTVDSGWNCTATALGSYVAHGVTKLQFAGATWEQPNGGGIVTAILSLPSGPLDAAWVEEFYTAGAVAGKQTGAVKTDRPTYQVAGQVFRLETINDLSLQTVVIWPAGPYVHVVIVATQVSPDAVRADHDDRVRIAVEVAAGVPVR